MKALPLKTVQITFDYRTDKDLKEIMEQVKSEVIGRTKNVTAGCRGLRYSIRTIESTK